MTKTRDIAPRKPDSGALQKLTRAFHSLLDSVLRRNSHPSTIVIVRKAVQNEPELRENTAAAQEFEAAMTRMLRARLNPDRSINSHDIQQLSKDVVALLTLIVKKFKKSRRGQQDLEEKTERLLLLLKTVTIEIGGKVFNEETRSEFSRQLDLDLLIHSAKHRE